LSISPSACAIHSSPSPLKPVESQRMLAASSEIQSVGIGIGPVKPSMNDFASSTGKL